MADRSAFLKLARDRFEQAKKAEEHQRARELEDLRFYAGDQWPQDIKNLRKGQVAQNGLPPVPARPCITINKTREPVRQVLNQERQSDMGIEIVPADDFGELTGPIDATEIELREGLVRRIQRESSASDARTWAFARGTIAGRGFYAVMTRYVPGKTNDQEIYIHRFWNQACVSLDPAHEQPDGSDAEWEFFGTDYTEAQYKAEFPKRNGKKNAACDYTDDEFRALGDARPDWFSSEGETRMYRVMNYFYTVSRPRELVTFAQGERQRTEWADEVEGAKAIPELVASLQGWVEVEESRRETTEKSIKWAKLDGCDDDVLDETDWLGPDMPIIKVLGEELQPYDNERRCEGMVRPMREPGQGFNFMVSRWVETIGLAPLPPIMMAEGQDEGYEQEWDAINTRTLGRVHYKQTDLQDRAAPPPTVPPNRNPPIEALAASVSMFDQSLESTSGIHAPALGKSDPSVRSNRQAQSLIDQSSESSNHYLDNLKRSMRYEAQIINNLLYPIYGRPGRIARLINGEGKPETVLLHQPMLRRGGKPVPAPPQHPEATKYTLTKDAKFNVAIKISRNTDTRRMQEAETVGQLIAKNPELMTWFGDLYFENLDGPGHNQMAERAKVMLAQPIQQMLVAKQQGADPHAAAQLAEKDAQIQQMQAELQKAAKPTAVEEIRQQGETERTHLELLQAREKMHADNETKIAVAELGAKVDRLALFLEERARLGVQQDAEAGRAHDVGMAAMSQANAAEQAEQGRRAEAEAAEAARAHEAEMAAQAAQQPQGA